MTLTLTEAQDGFLRHGFARLGRVLDDSALEALRLGLDDMALGRVTYPQLLWQFETLAADAPLPAPAERKNLHATLAGIEAHPLLARLIRHDVFRDAASFVFGPHASVSLFRALLRTKAAGHGENLPWYQDAGDAWRLDREPWMTVWIAVDPANPQNGCMQVVPGSHRLGLVTRNGCALGPELVEKYCAAGTVMLDAEPGEAILMHNFLLHRSGLNATEHPRRSLSFCYLDGRTLSTLTGERFPTVFGEAQRSADVLEFWAAARHTIATLRGMFEEAERYAKSLAEENERLRAMRKEAEDYALSLVAENESLRKVARGEG